MTLATRLQSKMAVILARFGRTATVTIETDGAYDPATGKVEDVTTTTATVTVSPLFAHRRSMDQAGARMGAGHFLVGSLDLTFTPTQGQKWTIGAETWTVLEVQRIAVNATDVAYRVTVEKGGR